MLKINLKKSGYPFFTLCLFIYIIIASGFIYFTNFQKSPFHIDEHEFLKKSVYFDLLFIKHDTKNPLWHDYKYGDIAQPKVGPYIYGAVLHLSGISDISRTFTTIGFNQPDQIDGTWKDTWWYRWWYKKPVDLPKELVPCFELIFLARKVAIVFTVASIALIFILGLQFFGLMFAVIASGLTAITPLLLFEGRNAMTDTMQLFFFFVNLIIFTVFHKNFTQNKKAVSLILAVVLGVTSALGAGIKVTGAMTIMFVLLMYCLIFMLKLLKKQSTKMTVFIGIISVSIYLLNFYSLHPYLHQKTFYNLRVMYLGRLISAQDYYWKEYPDTAIKSRPQAFFKILEKTLLPGKSYINFPIKKFPLDLILYLSGLLLLIKKSFIQITKKRTIDNLTIFLAWNLWVFFCLVMYLNNDWSRYYLPQMVNVCLVQAYTISFIISASFAKIKQSINF